MRRRALLSMVGMAILAPWVALGQTPGRVYRVAFVGYAQPLLSATYRERLAEHGFVEGKNLELRYFGLSDGTPEMMTAITREALAWKPDVIRVFGTMNVRLVAAMTSTIPIVFDGVADPVGSGLVGSLAQPGGNLTGTSLQQAELITMRLALVRELLPRATRVALIVDSSFRAIGDSAMNEIRASARQLGLTVEEVDPSRYTGHYVGALEGIAKTRPDAVIHAVATLDERDLVALGPQQKSRQLTFQTLLVDFQHAQRIPVIFMVNEGVERGLLASLGGSYQETAQIVADQTAKLLRGTPVAQIPVQQIARILIGINLRTAKELGIAVPQSVLIRADTVIQ